MLESSIDARSFRLVDEWATPCFDKLSRLDWKDGFAFEVEGVRIGVRVNDPNICDEFRNRLPAMAKPTSAAEFDCVFSIIRGQPSSDRRIRNHHLLYCNHTRLFRSETFDDLFQPFSSALALVVASLAKRRVFVHAGAVAWNGWAIILPGPSMAGKSTLVAAGADYLSDEFAIIDADGLVHPYAKPISLRHGGGTAQTDHPIEAFGGRCRDRPVPLGLVLMCHFDSEAVWRPMALTPGQGLLALLANTPSSRISPHDVVPVLSSAVTRATLFSSARAEADAVAGQILQMTDTQGGSHA
ncbi:hypothetical protein [Oricola sp.]|uniref:hypothetical protein n=1 Tax=Oricola sp. TaxID=1979950 RepID=UPI0025D6EB85|nr:hypothetical protein [Oricola sp.]MCI5075216.1 hypothetical protein [Oricola sp.]